MIPRLRATEEEGCGGTRDHLCFGRMSFPIFLTEESEETCWMSTEEELKPFEGGLYWLSPHTGHGGEQPHDWRAGAFAPGGRG